MTTIKVLIIEHDIRGAISLACRHMVAEVPVTEPGRPCTMAIENVALVAGYDIPSITVLTKESADYICELRKTM